MYTATLTIDNVVPTQTISLQSEMNVREFIEAAFVQLQSVTNLDPFKFTIDYFGYDYYGGNTSYLGYGVVSIGKYVSDSTNYWDLYINGKVSTLGIDSYLVQAGDRIEYKFVPVSAAATSAAARMHQFREQRASTA
jgi:hypothetical protein